MKSPGGEQLLGLFLYIGVNMGAWVHRLLEVDPESRTGVCAHCGPVGLKKCGSRFRCRTAWRESNRANRNAHYNKRRRPYRHHVGDTCERCGFVAEHPCQLDVHHRDHDHSNHDLENLETICANCHRLEHHGDT